MTLIDNLREFSQRHDVTFELELDGTFVGAIDHGKLDRNLAEGLLGEWKRQLRL